MIARSLSDLLGQLATDVPRYEGGARLLDGDDVFAAILKEIDGSVLPTGLMFRSGENVLDLTAAGRRLCRVKNHAEALSPHDEASIFAAMSAISEFAHQASGPVKVVEDLAPAEVSDPSDRVTISSLIETAREQTKLSPPTIEGFAQSITGVAHAALVVYGRQITETKGPEDAVRMLTKRLEDQVYPFIERRIAENPNHEDPSLTMLSSVVLVPESYAMGYASFGEFGLLFLIPDDQISLAVQSFRESGQ